MRIDEIFGNDLIPESAWAYMCGKAIGLTMMDTVKETHGSLEGVDIFLGDAGRKRIADSPLKIVFKTTKDYDGRKAKTGAAMLKYFKQFGLPVKFERQIGPKMKTFGPWYFNRDGDDTHHRFVFSFDFLEFKPSQAKLEDGLKSVLSADPIWSGGERHKPIDLVKITSI